MQLLINGVFLRILKSLKMGKFSIENDFFNQLVFWYILTMKGPCDRKKREKNDPYECTRGSLGTLFDILLPAYHRNISEIL